MSSLGCAAWFLAILCIGSWLLEHADAGKPRDESRGKWRWVKFIVPQRFATSLAIYVTDHYADACRTPPPPKAAAGSKLFHSVRISILQRLIFAAA